MIKLTKRERDEFAAAVHNLDSVYELLMDAEKQLAALKDAPGVAERAERIANVKRSVAGVKSAVERMGDVYTSAAPLLGSFAPHLPVSALLAIRGGTAALSAINYETRRFIRESRGEVAAPGGLAQLLEWGALGLFAGFAEKHIENERGH